MRAAGLLLGVTVFGVMVGCAGGERKPSGLVLSPDDGPLASLHWLSGVWAGEDGGAVTEEHWMCPQGRLMLGMNRVSDGGFELLRIEARSDGIHYLASPGGKHPPAAFRMVEQGANSVVFHSPDHDFPHTIRYVLKDGVLHASIEGGEGAERQTMHWTWRRARLTTN